MKETLTFAQRLQRIEEREGISGNELARRLGVRENDYRGHMKTNHNPPTTAWRIALFFIDKFGTKALPKI